MTIQDKENTGTPSDARIGVYLCHCGANIAGVVDIDSLEEFTRSLPGVALVRQYQFMCSEPGQQLIRDDIKEHALNRVVVAACSPLMHEPTFRDAVEEAGMNRYLFQQANVREHCSWVTEDHEKATDKAKAFVSAAVHKALYLEPLESMKVKINPATLVIGGGIAGIQAALNLAEAGKKVYLVEREPSIGGHMAEFDKTFPTLDCAACILTPKMVQVGKNPNIELLSYSEVKEVSGYIGNFEATVVKKSRYVDENTCTGCGECWSECPATVTPKKRTIKIGKRIIKKID
jgi:heterodisulfide reductase subunit A